MEIADILAETLKREDREALLNLHRHLHGLAAQGEVDCERLTTAHELVAAEVLRRGYTHGSELECGKQKGLVLPAPHAFLVWKGKQTAVAASPEFHAACGAKVVDVPLALVCEGEAYGLVTLGTPAVMDCKTFDLPEFTEEHRVRPEERRAWWPETEKLFVYPIKGFQGFKELQRVAVSGDGLCEVRFKQYQPPSEREATVLRQSEKLPKVIVLQPHAVSLTGSVLYGKHEPADTDVVLVGAEWREDEEQFVVPLTPTFKEKLERVLKAVYQTGNPVQYISEGTGATFDHLPLYSLALVRLPRLEVERVSELEPEMAEVGYDKQGVKALTTSSIERLLRGASAEVRKQAMQSYQDDEVIPGRPFVPLKPMRPVEPSQRQLFSRFAEFAKAQNHWPLLVSAKRDGVRHILHRRGDRIWVYSDDGVDNAERLPELVKRLQQVPGDWVLDSEIEFWRDGQHFPREAAAGAVHSGGGIENLVANVFAVVYWDGKDLHKESFADTLPILETLPVDTTSDKPLDADKGRLNLIPQIETGEADFEKVCMATAYLPGVEGVVVRRPDLQNYPLDGDPGDPPVEFKWHKASEFQVVIIERTETATPGVFNYLFGIPAGDLKPKKSAELDGKIYLVIGRSFSTTEKFEPGSEISIEAESVNLTEDKETGEVDLSFWVPNFIKEAERA
jgi:hypothetical protein